MFEIQHDSFLSYDRVKLINSETDEYITVIPSLGGVLHEMVLAIKGDLFNVINNYHTEKDLVDNISYRSCLLFPFPGRIPEGKYSFNGNNYQLPVNEEEKNNSLHGFVYNKSFKIDREEATNEFARLILSYNYLGDLAGYPFPFKIIVEFTLSSTGMDLNIKVKNTGKVMMPVGCGWHPYFSFGEKVDKLLLELPVTDEIVLGDNLVPTGETRSYSSFVVPKLIGDKILDSSFVVKKNKVSITKLTSLEKNATINLWQDSINNTYNYLQIYIPPDRKSIAIEPVTCSANTFNTKVRLITLNPGEVFQGSMGVNMSKYIAVHKS